MKKTLSLFSAFFFISLVVLFSLHLMSSDKSATEDEEDLTPDYIEVGDLVTLSGEAGGKIPVQSDLQITTDNTDDKIKGLNNPEEVDEFILRLEGPTYDRVNTTNPVNYWETITMKETEKDSKIYKNSTKVSVVIGENADRQDDDGKLVMLSVTDYFTIGFENGTFSTNTDGKSFIHSYEQRYGIFTGGSGTVSITQDAKVGDPLTIKVTDTDLFESGFAKVSSVEVIVTTDKGESEKVTLTVPEVGAGYFSTELPTVGGLSAGTNDDGTLNVSAATVVTVAYTDTFDENAEESTVTAETTIGGAGVLGAIAITDPAKVGDDLVVTVTDADLNTDASTAQTVAVTVTSDKGESESFELTETGLNTGIFEGSISSTSGATAGTDDDGTINGDDGTVITATYDDEVDEDGLDPEAVTVQVTLTEVNISFDTFIGSHVENTRTVQYNGSTTNSGIQSDNDLTAADYYCYGADYEIYQANGDLDVYNNNSFDSGSETHCSSGSSFSFSNAWQIDGTTLSIDNGTGFEDWTLEIISATQFKISILTGGAVLTVRYYDVVD